MVGLEICIKRCDELADLSYSAGPRLPQLTHTYTHTQFFFFKGGGWGGGGIWTKIKLKVNKQIIIITIMRGGVGQERYK